MKVFINSSLIEAPETIGGTSIDPTDRGLTLGDGVFETIAVRSGRILRMNAHLSRFSRGASILGIESPMVDEDLIEALDKVLQANAITDGALRITLTRGPSIRGLMPPKTPSPSLIITASINAPDFDAGGCVKTVIVSGTRCNEYSPLSSIKSLNYLDNILALMEAREKGADDALLLNSTGNIASASSSNLFAVFGGELVTPPIKDGCLGGIMRADVIRCLNGVERSIPPLDLAKASEAFLTNCLSIRPIISVDGQLIRDGQVGIVTQQAQKMVLRIK
jgi:branched-chain amino acid aminotransferase